MLVISLSINRFPKIRILRWAEITYSTFPSRKRRPRGGNTLGILGKYFFTANCTFRYHAHQIQKRSHMGCLLKPLSDILEIRRCVQSQGHNMWFWSWAAGIAFLDVLDVKNRNLTEFSCGLKKSLSKSIKNFNSKSILKVRHLVFRGSVKKTTKFIKNHQNASNLLLNFLYKKSMFSKNTTFLCWCHEKLVFR